MAKLKIFGDHKFVTQGIKIQKGPKKVNLEGKKALEYLDSFNMDEICLYIFTSKTKADTCFTSLTFNKASAKLGATFSANWNVEENVFEVELRGEFERDLTETELLMLFDNGQTIEDVEFSIQGLLGGEIFKKGFISWFARPDEENLEVFPKVKFEFTP